jgi:predicted nuclease of predicted toxin-antitoxin system
VHQEQLIGCADSDVWKSAQNESRFLITQDLDFSDSRKYVPGSHHGILLVRLRFPNRRNLTARIVELFQTEDTGDWAGCFVVATERKIRVTKSRSKPTL